MTYMMKLASIFLVYSDPTVYGTVPLKEAVEYLVISCTIHIDEP